MHCWLLRPPTSHQAKLEWLKTPMEGSVAMKKLQQALDKKPPVKKAKVVEDRWGHGHANTFQ